VPVELLIFFSVCSLIVSVGSLILSSMNFSRSGNWKRSEDGKALVDKVGEIDQRLTSVESTVKNLATKEDVAELKAEVRGLERTITNVDSGVSRIEGFLMEAGRK
jgi:hypothetical protein